MSHYSLRELTIEITQECPLKCLICSSRGGEKAANELNLAELRNIIDAALELGVEVISLSGGEPLVSENTLPLIGYAKSRGIEVHVYTCGNTGRWDDRRPVSRRKLRSLRESLVDKMIFSVHGPNAQIHDMITTRQGSFRNLMTSITRAKEVGLASELHFVPVALNYKYMPEVMALAEKLQLRRVGILRFVPHGRGLDNKHTLEMRGEAVLRFGDILKSINDNTPVDVRIGSHLNCMLASKAVPCSAGVDKAVMRPDGLVFPCVSMKRYMEISDGNNVRERTLQYIWESSGTFREVRGLVKKLSQTDCKQCVNYELCKGGCLTQRLISNGNSLTGKDPYCTLELRRDILSRDREPRDERVVSVEIP